MVDLCDLPTTFEELRASPPEGFTLSERVIDPVIIIDRVGQKIMARLAGMRVHRGTKSIHRAPGNRHSWVVDGTTIRPLPRDAAHIFLEMMKGSDPDKLP